MNPDYQQMMVQQLLGSGQMPQGMNGQMATTPYGQGFQTGNMMQTPGMMGQTGPLDPGVQQMTNLQTGQPVAASTVLQQPMAAYSTTQLA